MVTGHGLKTVEALAGTAGPTATIAPTLEAFDRAMAEAGEQTGTSSGKHRDAASPVGAAD
jgi:hypothetical protein